MNTSTKPAADESSVGDSSTSSPREGVDKTGHKVQEMFAQIAPRYDLMNHVLSLGIDIRWRHRVIKEMGFRDSTSSDPVLDCCTGTGDLAILIAKAAAGRFEVEATDFCAPMLEQAERKRVSAGLEGVKFQEADSMSLPFPDDHFQAVTCAFGLRNIQDTEQGLKEMARVCKPGGQVGILEFSHPTAPVLKQSYQAYFKHVLPRIGQAVARNDKSAYEYLPNSVSEFPSGQALAEVMKNCGYRSVDLFPMTLGVATLYLGRV